MAKKVDETGTGIAVYEGSKYEIIKGDLSEMSQILEANIGAENEIGEFDLDRVGMPGAGGLAWNVPDINGEPEPVAEIVGVILLHGDRRSFWKKSFDETGGGVPPDCSSLDGRVGLGYIRNDEPSDDNPPKRRACKTCPLSQWGSVAQVEGKENNGQACSARKLLYMIRENDILPLVIDLAPTSVGLLTKFMLRLTSRRVPCYGAVVGLKLKNEQSKGGVKYSVVAPRLISVLNEEETKDMYKAAEALRPFFNKTGISAGEEVVEPTVKGAPVDVVAESTPEDSIPDPT